MSRDTNSINANGEKKEKERWNTAYAGQTHTFLMKERMGNV